MSAQTLQTLILNMLDASAVTLSVLRSRCFFRCHWGCSSLPGACPATNGFRCPSAGFCSSLGARRSSCSSSFFYFVPPDLLGIGLPRFWAAILAFSVNYAAYFAEIFRGGIEAVDGGQIEAAKVLGFSRLQTFFRITLPQVVKIILPSLGNEFMTLVKDTALAQTIGVAEIFRLANTSASGNFSTVPIFIAGIFYFVMNGVVSLAFSYLGRKLVL